LLAECCTIVGIVHASIRDGCKRYKFKLWVLITYLVYYSCSQYVTRWKNPTLLRSKRRMRRILTLNRYLCPTTRNRARINFNPQEKRNLVSIQRDFIRIFSFVFWMFSQYNCTNAPRLRQSKKLNTSSEQFKQVIASLLFRDFRRRLVSDGRMDEQT
jgi:hypothetical protein